MCYIQFPLPTSAVHQEQLFFAMLDLLGWVMEQYIFFSLKYTWCQGRVCRQFSLGSNVFYMWFLKTRHNNFSHMYISPETLTLLQESSSCAHIIIGCRISLLLIYAAFLLLPIIPFFATVWQMWVTNIICGHATKLRQGTKYSRLGNKRETGPVLEQGELGEFNTKLTRIASNPVFTSCQANTTWK